MSIEVWQSALNLWYVWISNLIFMLFILKAYKKQQDNNIVQFQKIASMTWRALLNSDETIEIFIFMFNDFIVKKLKFLKEILIKDTIKEREPQIKKNIYSKLVEIINEQSNRLKKYNSPAWDLWDILLTIDFKKFCEDINEIFFWKDTIDNKIHDLERMMLWYLNDLTTKINWEIKSRDF